MLHSVMTLPAPNFQSLNSLLFSGDVREQAGFWEQFDVGDNSKSIASVHKFQYLRSVLKGEAKSVVAGLALTNDNYDIACSLLHERFGRTEKVKFAQIQDLLTLAIQENPAVDQLWEFYNTLQTHVRSLDALQVSGEQCETFLSPSFSYVCPKTCVLSGRGMGTGMRRISTTCLIS